MTIEGSTFSRDARDLDTPGWLMLSAEAAALQLPERATRLNTTSWARLKGKPYCSSGYCFGPLPLCSAMNKRCQHRG